MKFYTYLFLSAMLMGVASYEPLKAQEKTPIAKTVIQSLSQAYTGLAEMADYAADLLNPLKFPLRYGRLAWFVGSEFCGAVSEAIINQEFTNRTGYACLQSAGFVALSASPWLLWKLWGKGAYNRQAGYYAYVRDTIHQHHLVLTLPRGIWTTTHAAEMKKVIADASLCRRTFTFYLCKDDKLVQLVNDFYANSADSVALDRICGEIQDCCNGKIK